MKRDVWCEAFVWHHDSDGPSGMRGVASRCLFPAKATRVDGDGQLLKVCGVHLKTRSLHRYGWLSA